ncbi:MAG: hypothetical protein WAW07_03700 [Bacteroidales bacterium]
MEKEEDFFDGLINEGWISRTFYNVTIRALQLDSSITNRNNKLTLYKGATYNNPVKGMYSFFPCLVDACFERPEIIGIDISSKLNTSRKYLNVPPGEAWREVVRQVFNKKLLLGVYAEEPPVQIP